MSSPSGRAVVGLMGNLGNDPGFHDIAAAAFRRHRQGVMLLAKECMPDFAAHHRSAEIIGLVLDALTGLVLPRSVLNIRTRRNHCAIACRVSIR